MFTHHYTFTKHAVERLYERTTSNDESKLVLSIVKKYLNNNVIRMVWECLVRGDEHEYEVNIAQCPDTWEYGVTHMDKDYQLWSGPYRDWIQHRKLIEEECYNGSLEHVRQSS